MTGAYTQPPRQGRTKRILIAAGFVAAAGLGAAGGFLFVSFLDMPDIADLTRYSASPATKLFDSSDPPELIAQLSIEQRTFVPITRMPRTLLDAVVAVEDERFYSHWGLDFRGIFRAAVVNILRGRKAQGASTITQQLSRTLFLTLERTWKRKITEALLAIQIERTYRKEEILEMYLNQVYFGAGAYGVEQAARAYFGKHVEELTLPECALLAGLPQAPSDFNPRINEDSALARRNVVLEKMADNGFITREDAQISAQAPIHLRETELTNAPYFAAYVSQMLEEKYGNQAVYHGGLSVYTTLDLRTQLIAQRTLELGIRRAEALIQSRRGAKADSTLPLQGALIALNPRSGAILAMVGGRNFKKYQFNRAIQARRQPGSSFKPFIYTTAFLRGWTSGDVIDDSPEQFTGTDGNAWQPTNYTRKLYGPTTLRHGLAFSRNIVTVKLLSTVGVGEVIDTAKKFGFAGPFRRDLTLALGTNEMTLLEMTSAFSVFANNGARAAPHSVRLVKDGLGNVLEQNEPRMFKVISPQLAYLVLSILRDVVDYGTARGIRRQGFKYPAAGKTGTTDGFTDAWFIGFTPTLACGIWLGYDDNRTLGRNMSGGLIAAPIWAEFMAEALENQAVGDFEKPDGLVSVSIDAKSGLLATEQCERIYTELYLEGTAPTRECDIHDAEKHISQLDLADVERLQSTKGAGTAFEDLGDEERRDGDLDSGSEAGLE